MEPDREPFTGEDRLRFQNTIGAVFAVGLTPTAMVGFEAGSALRWRHYSLAAEGRVMGSPVNYTVDREYQGGAFFTMGVIRGCWETESLRFPLQVCTLMEAGRFMMFRVSPYLQEQEIHPFTAGFGMRFATSWQFGPGAYLRVFNEFDFPLVKPTFTFNRTVFWEMPNLSSIFGIELTWVISQPKAWDKIGADLFKSR